MRPKIVKTELAEYEPAEWGSLEVPPVEAIFDNVLVLADTCVTTRGGILLPEKHAEQMNRAAESGIVVGLGPDAFRWNATRTKEFNGARPEIGARVCFTRYSGQMIHRDGKMFFLMSDSTIGGVERT